MVLRFGVLCVGEPGLDEDFEVFVLVGVFRVFGLCIHVSVRL